MNLGLGTEEDRDAEVGGHRGLILLRGEQGVAFHDVEAGLEFRAVHLGEQVGRFA